MNTTLRFHLRDAPAFLPESMHSAIRHIAPNSFQEQLSGVALMDSKNTERRITVVHSTHLWLSQTMPWLYTQVKCLPSRIESHVICDKTRNLDQFPFENLVSADKDSPFWTLLGSKSWRVSKRRRSYRLRGRAQSRCAEVLHSHFGGRGWSDIADAADCGLKHVVTFYGHDASRAPQVEPIWRERYKELFATADLFLCEGPHLGRSLVALGCPHEKVRVQHLGINLETIAFQPRRWRPDEPLRVLIAGSFVEKKGIPYAIEALGRIRERAKPEITVIGDAIRDQERSREEKAKIIDAINRCDLGSQTRLLGYQPHSVLLETAYWNHLFISPSVTASDGDTEGGAPVSVIEMAASGMPVVSSRHCDIPEVLEDGVTGLLAEEADVDALESKLVWLMDHSDQWEQMVTAARRHIENEFSAPVQGARLAAHYDSLFVNS